MSNIKVIDINEEAKEEPVEEPQAIEEATEQIEPTNEVVDNTPVEEVKEEVKETKADSKQVQCPKCSKYMSLKNFRYRHEKLCTTEPKPVKPQANPKGKSKPKPKPKPQPIVEESEEEEEEEVITKPKLTQPDKKQILKPTNPLADARQSLASIRDITNHYQLLQQQYIQQKQAKYQNLCQSMFSSKPKKR